MFPSENIRPSSQKAHLLKSCLTTSIDGSEAMLPRQNSSASSLPDLKAVSLSVSFNGWRMANKNLKSWATKMSHLHKPTWKMAGIFEAVMASTIRVHKNTDLLLGIAEKWCPDTKTFIFPWGEATITLEDVMVLLGFSVLGLPYSATVESSAEMTEEKLKREWKNIGKSLNFVTQKAWMDRFMDSGDELEHVAFLVLWLSYFVFPSRHYHVYKAIFPVAVHISRGIRIAFAPAVLAHLYAELTLLKNHIGDFNITTITTQKIELRSLFKLVQVWTWERFRELQPKPPIPLQKGEPRLALWDDSKRQRRSNVRKILEKTKMDRFEWRPYTKAMKNWKIPQFYPDKAMLVPVDPNLDDEFLSFARCIKVSELVGIDYVEHYFPNRVASQFGLLQDVPCPVNRNNLSKEVAWDEYSKPIDDLTLFIPSRYAAPRFTPTFCEWWKKSSPEFQHCPKKNRVVESVTPRNITSDSVPSSSKRRKLMKPVCEDNGSNMGRYQTQVPSENNEEDDSLTIAQVMRFRKKNTALCPSDESYSSDLPKVLPLSRVLHKLGDGFPEKFKSSIHLRTTKNVPHERKKGKIVNCGGSASREKPLNELFQMDLVERQSEYLGNKRARADGYDESCMDCYDNITTVVMPRSREKSGGDESLGKNNNNRLEAANNDSWICQKLASEDETVVAPREIEKMSEEETGSKAGKSTIMSPANDNNSSDTPLGANVEVVDIVVSPPETRQNCDDEVNVNIINSEKKGTMVGDGTKEAECLVHEDRVKERFNEREEDDDERLKQKKLAIEELALNLEARIMKAEKNLAKIRERKTRRNQANNGVST